jgi:hypothetical protein
MALATLSIDMVARVAQFERDLGRAARVAEQNSARMQAAFARAGAGIVGLIGGVSVGAIVSLAKAQVDAIDGFNDLKDATGASIENISALDSLARRTGVTFDTVGTSLIKFNAQLKEGDKAGVFKALGLDVEKLKQLDPAEALRQTAVALSGFADDGNKARAVQELFGKSLREVAPLLKDLGEEGRLNATITTQQAEAAEKFNKELFQMKASIVDVARDISGPLVSAMNKLIERFREGAKDGENFYTTLLRLSSNIPIPQIALPGQVLNAYDRSQGGPKDRLDTIERALQDPTLSASERAALEGRRAPLRSRINDGYASSVTTADMSDAFSRRFQARSLNVPDDKKKGAKGPDLAKQGFDLAQSLTAQDSGLTGDFFEKWEKLTAAYKGNKISLTQLTEAQALLLKQQPFMKSEQFAGDVSDALSRRTDSMERARAATQSLNEELERLSGRTGDDRKRQLTGALEERLNAGEVFSQEELDRIVRGIGGVTEVTADATKVASDFGAAFSNAFEDATLKGKDLGEVVKGLATSIASIAIQKSVTIPLGNALGTALTGMFGFASGGVMTGAGPVPLRTYARGGVANSPQLAMFGEGSMAEAYVPLPDGRRIPVAMKGGGGRPIVQHISMTVGDVADMARVRSEIKAANGELVAGMRRAGTYGRG